MARRGGHRRVVSPPTRLGQSAEGDLTPDEPAFRPSARTETPAPRREQRPESAPVLPDRASEDTDAAWGELPTGSDDARYLRDKPPHWE